MEQMILVITLIDMQKERFVHFSDQFLCACRRSYGPAHVISNAPNFPKVLELCGAPQSYACNSVK